MRTLPESFVQLLGPLRHLLHDDGVTAIILEGSSAAWVERVGAAARAAESVPEDAIERMVTAVREHHHGPESGPVGALLPGGGHVSVVDAPGLPGGAIVVVETWRSQACALNDLGPADVLDVVRAVLSAGMAVLVTGSTAEVRQGVLEALAAQHPREGRRVVVDTRPLAVEGALHLAPPEPTPTTVARFFAGLERLRAALVCVPEMGWGGAAALHAMARIGTVLASSAGPDAEAALALLGSSDARAHALFPAAFRVVVELDDPPVARLRALRECRTSPSGVGLVTLWSRTAANGGAWRSAPSWGDRLGLAAPPWAGIPDVTASMFAERVGSTTVTHVPLVPGPVQDGVEVTHPHAQRPPEVTAPLPPPPPPTDDWTDATVQQPPTPSVLDALRQRRVAATAGSAPPVPSGTDVENDVSALTQNAPVPTPPRVPGPREKSGPRKNLPPPPEPRRPPPPPPTLKGGPNLRPSPRPFPPPPPPSPPTTKPGHASEFASGDNVSGVFASAKDVEKDQDED